MPKYTKKHRREKKMKGGVGILEYLYNIWLQIVNFFTFKYNVPKNVAEGVATKIILESNPTVRQQDLNAFLDQQPSSFEEEFNEFVRLHNNPHDYPEMLCEYIITNPKLQPLEDEIYHFYLSIARSSQRAIKFITKLHQFKLNNIPKTFIDDYDKYDKKLNSLYNYINDDDMNDWEKLNTLKEKILQIKKMTQEFYMRIIPIIPRFYRYKLTVLLRKKEEEEVSRS
jgi:hypothetical protein